MSDTIDPEIARALDERISWIHEATDRAAAGNWQAVTQAIEDLDDEHLPGMLYVLILSAPSHNSSSLQATAASR